MSFFLKSFLDFFIIFAFSTNKNMTFSEKINILKKFQISH